MRPCCPMRRLGDPTHEVMAKNGFKKNLETVKKMVFPETVRNVNKKNNMQSHRKMEVSISGLQSSHNSNGKFGATKIYDLSRIMMQRESKECYSKNQIRLTSQALEHMDTFHGGRMGIRYGLKDALSKFSDSLIWMVDQADVDNLEQSGALLSSLGKILQKNDIAVMVYLCCNEKLKKKVNKKPP